MPFVATPAVLGLIGAALGLLAWALVLWRRTTLQRGERLLLEERLATAQASLQGLSGELEQHRAELRRLTALTAGQQAELAVALRENQLHQVERQAAADAAGLRQLESERQQAELRRLDSERAALLAELREQQESHQQRLSDLQGARDDLRAQFAELAGKIFDERESRFAETSQQRLGQLLDPLKERIQAFEKRVDESYQQEARERFSLGKELERLQLLNQRLGDEATNLTRALKGQKTQGNWGELVLERVLESAGLERGREYETQVSLTAWQQFSAAEDDALRQLALKQHLQSLRSHLKGLSGKDYQRLDGLHSLDFVLLFVPIEAAFAAALQAEPGLFQEAFEQRVVIVSPTTLLATLQVVESLWRQERQSQNAREIAERAGQLYDKFAAFIADLDEVGNRLQQLDKAYAAARNKLVDGRGNLVGRIENLKLLGARASKSLPVELLERSAGLAADEDE